MDATATPTSSTTFGEGCTSVDLASVAYIMIFIITAVSPTAIFLINKVVKEVRESLTHHTTLTQKLLNTFGQDNNLMNDQNKEKIRLLLAELNNLGIDKLGDTVSKV